MRLRRSIERPGVLLMATVKQGRQNGFTLVEILVCMALIMFMMAILSQAFVAATGVFRNLKAAGDMAEKLRATTTLLQRDLAADHFEGRKRLSDPNFWVNGPPQQGFFRIWQGSAGTPEGGVNGAAVDTDGIGSFRSTDHMLAFTIKLRGNQMSDFLSSSPPQSLLTASSTFGPPEARYQTGATYNWQWAEVTWFLQPQLGLNGVQDTTITDPATGSLPVNLYTLYRNQRLAVPDNSSVVPAQTYTVMNNPSPTAPGYMQLQSLFAEVSSWPNQLPLPAGSLYFNSPIDLTVPSRRFGMIPPNLAIQGTTATANPAGMLLGTTFPASSWLNLPNGLGTWLLPGNGQASYPTLSQLGAAGTLAGADIQLTNVVSFDVRLLVPTVAFSSVDNRDPFVTLWQAPYTTPVTRGGMNNYNSQFFPANPRGPMVFDTWTSLNDSLTQGYYSTWNLPGPGVLTLNPPPNPIPPTNPNPPATAAGTSPGATSIPLWNGASGPIIKALQISIRIWDQKTNQTRQVTVVQAM
jgi:prepilin-type N-terminal cleavage/methylation domain-containing protein